MEVNHKAVVAEQKCAVHLRSTSLFLNDKIDLRAFDVSSCDSLRNYY